MRVLKISIVYGDDTALTADTPLVASPMASTWFSVYTPSEHITEAVQMSVDNFTEYVTTLISTAAEAGLLVVQGDEKDER